jgi:hypothetical protein
MPYIRDILKSTGISLPISFNPNLQILGHDFDTENRNETIIEQYYTINFLKALM